MKKLIILLMLLPVLALAQVTGLSHTKAAGTDSLLATEWNTLVLYVKGVQSGDSLTLYMKVADVRDSTVAVWTDSGTVWVGKASANLDDTDASIEWEDAAALESDGSLSVNTVDSDQYVDGSIDEIHLNVSNSPTDDYILSYNEAGTNFTWVAQAAGTEDSIYKSLTTDTLKALTGSKIVIDDTLHFDTNGVVSGIGEITGLTMLESDSVNASSVLQIGGVSVTSSAAEVNYNDLTTLGTSENSKVASYSASGKHTVASEDSIQIASGGVLDIVGTVNLPADAINAAGELGTDVVTMDAVDADGNFTTLTGNWRSTGEFSGGIQDTIVTDSLTVPTRFMYGGVIYVTGAALLTLPAVADGMNLTVITVGAVAVSVDPNANDLLILDGTALNDGDKATNTSTTGDMIVLTYYNATGFYAASGSPDGGKWTDGS